MRSLQKCQEQYTELHEENLQLDHEKELMSEQLDYWKSQQELITNYQKDIQQKEEQIARISDINFDQNG